MLYTELSEFMPISPREGYVRVKSNFENIESIIFIFVIGM